MKIGCVVMAAGGSVRFGSNKLLLDVGGRRMFEGCLDAVCGAFDAVAVVSGCDEILSAACERGFIPVVNDRPEDGVSLTVRLGLETLLRTGEFNGVMFAVADQPLLSAITVRRVVNEWERFPQLIVAASHGGKKGNPCMFPARLFEEIMGLTGDVGGSAVIRRHSELLRCVEVDAAELADIDTTADVRALL